MDRWEEAAKRLINETMISATEAAKLVPSSHGNTASWTIVRWIRLGKRGVYLDGTRASGKGWSTSREALTRFWAELSRAGADHAEVVKPAAASRLREQIIQAETDEALRVLAQCGGTNRKRRRATGGRK